MRYWNYAEFTYRLQKLINIDLSLYNERQMKRRIDSFLVRNRQQTYNDFFNAITRDIELRNKFIDFLTINVTEFFRNPPQWERIRIEIIPKLIELSQPLKIWSAACSTGEEPYSMVMLLNHFMDMGMINILATDIDKGAIGKAQKGIYDEKSMKNLSKGYISKYFNRDGERYAVKDELKKCVQFRRLNLLEDPYPKDCHMILCRNVMIYFTQDAKEQMYRRFYDSLLPGGVLFLGNTEQIINPHRYGFVSMKSFFYTKNYK